MKAKRIRKSVARSTIYDDVFRTMTEKMPELLLPLINEMFQKNYLEDESIELLKNERMTRRGRRITDSYFRVEDAKYHIECQSRPDKAIAIRMFEYDVAIAIENAEHDGENYYVVFPKSCVLYLRQNKKTKKKETVYVEFADGTEHSYEVPIVKVQDFSKDEIFEKNLVLFLPYYIMRYEKRFRKMNADQSELQHFLEEVKDILNRLDAFCSGGREQLYADLVNLILKIAEELLKNEVNVKKGVQKVMGGQVLELYSERLIREGKEEGIKEGMRALVNTCKSLGITKEITYQKIKEEFSCSADEANQLLEKYWNLD